MALDTEKRLNATYFTGVEVENTPMKGHKTLFVVGVQPVEDIIAKAEEAGVKHIYFGTSQSFDPATKAAYWDWHGMIYPILQKDYWCTLDFAPEHTEELASCDFNSFNKFIPMISVKLPNIKGLNYNATLKIDDSTWGATNPGVWCHPLNELMTRSAYTDWTEYVGDKE